MKEFRYLSALDLQNRVRAISKEVIRSRAGAAMLSKIYASVGGAFVGALLVWFLAHSYYSEKIERIYADYEASAAWQDRDALEQQLWTEHNLQDLLSSAETQVANDYATIENQYAAYFGAAPLGLQYQNGDGSHACTLSDSSRTSGAAAETCSCRRIEQAYNNLKQQCGLIAKERDQLAVDRNELITLYEQVRASYGN